MLRSALSRVSAQLRSATECMQENKVFLSLSTGVEVGGRGEGVGQSNYGQQQHGSGLAVPSL